MTLSKPTSGVSTFLVSEKLVAPESDNACSQLESVQVFSQDYNLQVSKGKRLKGEEKNMESEKKRPIKIQSTKASSEEPCMERREMRCQNMKNP